MNSAVANQMTASTPAIRPYLATYWFAAAAAGLSLFMVPFLTIGTQGGDVSDLQDQQGPGQGGDYSEKSTSVNPSVIEDPAISPTLPKGVEKE